tara:strand:+ start:3310 stop:3630 length:321 start_codon:yes stop_codon:yes gene_type:complete
MADEEYEHPCILLARSLPAPWNERFVHNREEGQSWKPYINYYALASTVLVVMRTRLEVAWCAYCKDVPGYNHCDELQEVLDKGAKISEKVARCLFPEIPKELPYAR